MLTGKQSNKLWWFTMGKLLTNAFLWQPVAVCNDRVQTRPNGSFGESTKRTRAFRMAKAKPINKWIPNASSG